MPADMTDAERIEQLRLFAKTVAGAPGAVTPIRDYACRVLAETEPPKEYHHDTSKLSPNGIVVRRPHEIVARFTEHATPAERQRVLDALNAEGGAE